MTKSSGETKSQSSSKNSEEKQRDKETKQHKSCHANKGEKIAEASEHSEADFNWQKDNKSKYFISEGEQN